MNKEILPVPYDKKLKVTEHIRNHLIPGFAHRGDHPERVLQILHRAGTWYAIPTDVEHEYRSLRHIAFYAGLEPIPSHKDLLAAKITQELDGRVDRYVPFYYYPKGNYRVLGLFAPNENIGWYIPEAKSYFTGALPVSTRDYHHPESPIYIPPVINIDLFMSRISTYFEGEIVQACNLEEIASAIAKFYFWGLAIIHPFLGGNHRGFDRFLEWGFVQKGIPMRVPQNGTLNIPNDDPFNIAIFRERRRLLTEFGLEEEKPIRQGKTEQPKWLKYQRLLNKTIDEILPSDFIHNKEIAQAMLNWL
ncbi:MAG: hypothetical protein UU73_C0003G0070 [Candidatus Daviesbacteria bacterium GW2011_GWA1_41_61]|uniref:Fido domain-containing protein n=1 Tax=Candidatus Daviesbacteria bacterium GW2011_GWA2_40_9 TaxID=1618424 RepID=A0A0G0U2C5_9BACT|nr:MAG: hypothetical protein UU26_C0003G0158 [Candidatus Daviesbacteria bacterium GW2011_GWC1_40_9]KKR83233.1 MAG: hypothetical protein UU29_C0007G0103 [Candidatus Daviesbacteria bacterium GW2011_GWA2_40_9]KKR93578.1 MAG: hypothetical protein UU44_C0002G0239 [Candidatus Daviesbacteria bacterium GW2011_GWB1_41_15]KKS14871.1 MAG: hypothetical protein UU73_C0003G0070 [Candidatus Daviesbacteria bacterium GW2011_GWA1_41_61]